MFLLRAWTALVLYSLRRQVCSRKAILAAAYCGAGAGLLAGPVFSFLLVLAARLLDAETGGIAALGEAAEAVGAALLWGPVAGAAGGLGIGALVALFKRSAPR